MLWIIKLAEPVFRWLTHLQRWTWIKWCEPKHRVLAGLAPGDCRQGRASPREERGRRQRDGEARHQLGHRPPEECQRGIKVAVLQHERSNGRHEMRLERGHLRVPAFTLEPRGNPEGLCMQDEAVTWRPYPNSSADRRGCISRRGGRGTSEGAAAGIQCPAMRGRGQARGSREGAS